MDPRFRWETTQLLNQMVAVWGEIPATLLMNFNPRKHILGLVGLDDVPPDKARGVSFSGRQPTQNCGYGMDNRAGSANLFH
jgi:hypothetical protein